MKRFTIYSLLTTCESVRTVNTQHELVSNLPITTAWCIHLRKASLSHNLQHMVHSGCCLKEGRCARLPVVQIQAFVSTNVADPEDLVVGEKYESIRRSLEMFTERDMLYGPISFDAMQRNNGRQAATTQFLPVNSSTTLLADRCITPLDVASTQILYPAPGSGPCFAGKIPYISTRNGPKGVHRLKMSTCSYRAIFTNPHIL